MNEKKEINSISRAIYYVAIIIAFCLFLIGLKELSNSGIILGLMWWILGIVSAIFLSGFGKIVDLLDNINKKIDKVIKS